MTEFGKSASKGCGWAVGCIGAPIVLLVILILALIVIGTANEMSKQQLAPPPVAKGRLRG